MSGPKPVAGFKPGLIPATDARSSLAFGEASTHKFIVVLVCADPHPLKTTADFVSQGAIVITLADGKAFAVTGEFLEIKRRMTGIVAPEPVIFHRQPLNGFG